MVPAQWWYHHVTSRQEAEAQRTEATRQVRVDNGHRMCFSLGSGPTSVSDLQVREPQFCLGSRRDTS
jgi:hypothetical protein